MSGFEIHVLPEAEAEARDAYLWYFERSPLAADAFRTELFQSIDGLAISALDWPEEDGIRKYHLRHFPYTVMYEASNDTVTMLAIAHQRRRPGYWRKR